MLGCLGKRTITGMLAASGRQFMDWTAEYRLFKRERFRIEELFNVTCRRILQEGSSTGPVVAFMDDTLIRKRGRKVSGTAWRRDPLGPAFHTNFIWGQRFLQFSLALPQPEGGARAIPVDLIHCPTPKKPSKKASREERIAYGKQKEQLKLSRRGVEGLASLRARLDDLGAFERPLIVGADGSYTNRTVLKNLPPRVTLIGRIRKDAKLYALPHTRQQDSGRPQVYGERVPSPEEIRQNPDIPWQTIRVYATGKMHTLKIKTLAPLRWRTAGEKHNLRLVVIAPLAYRLSKHSRILYRQPAYLICTDPELDVTALVQYYFYRWEIEVNFREEKTLMGCGEAQVRHPKAAANVPAFVVAIYAFLLLAAHRAANKNGGLKIPRPKWYPRKKNQRLTASEMLNLLRSEMWAKAIRGSFSGFRYNELRSQNPKYPCDSLKSAILYLRK